MAQEVFMPGCLTPKGRLQAEVETNHTQLQQKDDQLQQQGTELRERANQINRQQRELQTLRVWTK